MFNSCVISGVVLTKPDLRTYEGEPQTMFKLGITLGHYQAGYITVCCPQHLAPVAANYLQRGDRVAVSGVIGRYEYDPAIKPIELVLVAREMEPWRRPDTKSAPRSVTEIGDGMSRFFAAGMPLFTYVLNTPQCSGFTPPR